MTCLFIKDTVLFGETEKEVQRVVDEFYSVCMRRKLKVKAEKSKVMVFERREVEVVDFDTSYSVPVRRRCEVLLGGKKIEEVEEFKYLETVICKHGE